MYQGKYSKQDATPNPRRQRKERRTKGTTVFYSIYFGFIAVFLIVLGCSMIPLNNWLMKLEAAEPTSMRDQVYAQLFADPDWGKIYELAGQKDSAFETKQTYSAAMDQLVGEQKLTMLEASLGMSKNKKFRIMLESKEIASFILSPTENEDGDVQWQLDSVSIPNHIVTISRRPGQTLYLNGVALADEHVIQKVSTLADHYLPEGTIGHQMEVLRISGLAVDPVITAKDTLGMELAIEKNEDTGIYAVQSLPAAEATDEQKSLALEATKIYGKYMTRRASLSDVQKYFKTNSQFYKILSKSEVWWVKTGASISFNEPVYSNFYQYSDTLFSIMIDMTLHQTANDGFEKDYSLCNTLFFQYESGKWKVMEATNVNVQETVTEVLLTFIDGENTLSSEFVQADAKILTLPAVTPEEGYEFLGWYAEGDVLIFEANESNTVSLSGDDLLESMTLYTKYQKVEAQ